MSRPLSTPRRRARAQRQLASQGWLAIFLGVVLLLVIPAFMRGTLATSFGQALRPAGWAALAVGAALLGAHYVVRRRVALRESASDPTPTARPSTRSPRSTRRDTGPAASAASSPAPHASTAPRPAQAWAPAVLAAIEWRRFEALCEAFYQQVGLTTRSQSHGADGGVDIWLQSQHMSAPRIVQCKHWKTRPVGVKEMREFLGVMASHQLQSSTYITSSTFTADAAAFAKANGIQTHDGAALLKQISQRTPEQQAALLAVAQEGEYWRPTCASCGTKMVERQPKNSGREFWGCAHYPRCRGSRIDKAGTAAV